MAGYLLLILPPLFFLLWHLTSLITPPPPTSALSNKRIILLIAHPDDESMFFSPALQSLTQPSLSNHLKILCLSTGNEAGLGSTRRKELEAAALNLGVRRREDVFILDDETRFKDGMTETWDPKEIAKVLASAFAPQLNTPSPPPSTNSSTSNRSSDKKSKRKSTSTTATAKPANAAPTTTNTPSDAPRATIDVLLTFDSHGISSHPNHIALHTGAQLFLSNLMRGHSGYTCPVSLYTLTTVNIVRKYTFVFDAITTLVTGIYRDILAGFAGTGGGGGGPTKDNKSDKKAEKVVFVSGVDRYVKSAQAMVTGHKSQMVWFRWGWVALGRYMVVNDLRRERVVGVA